MDSKIIFLGIAWRAGRGVFERGGVWEWFRVSVETFGSGETLALQAVARGVGSLLFRVSSLRSLRS